MRHTKAIALASLVILAGCQEAAPPRDAAAAPAAGPAVALNPVEASDRKLLWGDTHLHTSASADAFEDGKTNADIDTAYRFARGLPVQHPRTGQRIEIDRPLDFLVVADHAELLGVFPRMVANDPLIVGKAAGKALHDAFTSDYEGAARSTMHLDPHGAVTPTVTALNTSDIVRSIWNAQIDAAERYNEPGKFTALIGWEWSSTPNGLNQHRVVFTQAGGDVARKFLPLSNYDTMRPEDLWRFLRETRDRTGADFIAMPHNSNVSQGQMWTGNDTDGKPIDAAYARERAEWERVVEITQYKGTSEAHPSISTSDEFANFEIRDTMFGSEPSTPRPGSYVRNGLLLGLDLGARLGVNPFQMGIIGSTDSHTGLSSQQESAFYGKSGADIMLAERAANALGPMGAWTVSAGGLAAAWADRNDRQSIFDAFRRREVYGTSGTRIALRVFGGFDFAAQDARARDFADVGYRKGVPMGGELLRPGKGRVPSLLIQAAKDAAGANLDRVQVVKGWRDGAGKLHEKIFNVAWSGNRRLDAAGKLPPVGDTVDLRTARYSNSIGAPELVTVWRDPEFKAEEAAFYYVRVLEIPTPRHQLFDAIALRMDPAKTGLPLTLQERAWSSPIWYRP